MLKRACGCCDTETPEPKFVYSTREGATVRTRFRHEACGKAWWQHEDLDGTEIAVHVDA